MKKTTKVKIEDLFRVFRSWFKEAEKSIILIIDEVDTAANNQIFLDFLAQLCSLYIKREKNSRAKTFQSVILAGVTDVKHLKGKIREEDQHKVNSPWNIAADFDIDMSLSEPGIKGMLDEMLRMQMYGLIRNDHNTVRVANRIQNDANSNRKSVSIQAAIRISILFCNKTIDFGNDSC